MGRIVSQVADSLELQALIIIEIYRESLIAGQGRQRGLLRAIDTPHPVDMLNQPLDSPPGVEAGGGRVRHQVPLSLGAIPVELRQGLVYKSKVRHSAS